MLNEPPVDDRYSPSGLMYKSNRPKAALKTNFPVWATTTTNLAGEITLARKWSFETSFIYNPWRFNSEKTHRFWAVQPELRYWFCDVFENHFVGVHGIYGKYNIGNTDDIPFTDIFEDHKYKGKAYGGGISYGYHMPIGKQMGLEFTLGVGYIHLAYDKYYCSSRDELIGKRKKDSFGPTKAGISLVFMIK